MRLSLARAVTTNGIFSKGQSRAAERDGSSFRMKQ